MKTILASIVQDEQDWLPIMLKSVIDSVDKVVLVDSGSKDRTLTRAKKICRENKVPIEILTYKRTEPTKDDGRQRNVYLNYLIKNHLNDWCIVLDADEVIKGNLTKVMESIYTKAEEDKIDSLNLKTHHLVGDLAHTDSTVEEHWTLRRLFKIKEGLNYPETEHNVLQGCKKTANFHSIDMWHFAHVRKSLFYWREKYKNMKERSNIHPLEFQEKWYYSNLFGTYPTNQIDISELPRIIKQEFFIDYKRKPMKTLISIATVPDNTNKMLRCLNSIERCTHADHQVLITNNNYVGFAYAHNKALQKVMYDEELDGVVLINDDCVVKNFDWLEKLKMGDETITGVKGSLRESEVGDYLAFYCVYIPKFVIKMVGLLDERFQLGEFEDVDYCKRARDCKFNIAEIDDELIHHDTCHTTGNLTSEQNKKRIKNKELFDKKWGIEWISK